MIHKHFVDWWDGYETLLSDREPIYPKATNELASWIVENVGGMYYNPLPFHEFIDIPPLRHHPHIRLESCMEVESFEGKSVLDIGANMGYYAFMALEAGAADAMAVETYDKGCEVMTSAAKAYGLEHKLLVSNSNILKFDFKEDKPDIVFAFSVLPYLGQPDPEPLLEVLRQMAKHCGVCFIEMGDGGSELTWCKGDDKFQDLFESSGFKTVNNIGQMFSSHSNTFRTLWECRGTS